MAVKTRQPASPQFLEIIKSRGEYYGYPKCCIQHFVDEFDDLGKINKARNKELGLLYALFTNVSHVPCPKCYATLLREKKHTLKFYDIRLK